VLTFCNVYWRMGLTYTVWETMVSILFLTHVLSYVDKFQPKNIHVAVLIAVFVGCVYLKETFNGKMMYHTGGWVIFIGSWLVKRNHKWGWAYLIAAWLFYFYNAINIFGKDNTQIAIISATLLGCLSLAVGVTQISNAPIQSWVLQWEPVRETILYLSRRAAGLYVTHLAVLRCVYNQHQYTKIMTYIKRQQALQ